jgi:hypothetical protein
MVNPQVTITRRFAMRNIQLLGDEAAQTPYVAVNLGPKHDGEGVDLPGLQGKG